MIAWKCPGTALANEDLIHLLLIIIAISTQSVQCSTKQAISQRSRKLNLREYPGLQFLSKEWLRTVEWPLQCGFALPGIWESLLLLSFYRQRGVRYE